MPVIDEILNFLTNDLNIKISNKTIDLINNKFYPNIKDKIYWSISIEARHHDSFYEGIISKEEYDKLKTLPPDTQIDFPEIDKYVNDECELKEISFKEDVNEKKNYMIKDLKTVKHTLI
jgi:hypothetical protein